jgi:phosphoribosylformylglycinamidine synthase PurS subunit
MPKPEVADPQGQAIEAALARLALPGCDGVTAHDVRVGKVFHLTLEAADRAVAERALRALADRVLANPNIEAFECKLA